MVDDFCASYVGALKLSPESGDEMDDTKKRKGDDDLDSRSKRQKRVNLPKASTNLLKKWLFDHLVYDSIMLICASFIHIQLKKKNRRWHYKQVSVWINWTIGSLMQGEEFFSQCWKAFESSKKYKALRVQYQPYPDNWMIDMSF